MKWCLSCCFGMYLMQNFVVIAVLISKWEQNEIFVDFELRCIRLVNWAHNAVPTFRESLYCTTLTKITYISDLEVTVCTTYLVLVSEPWGIYCDDFGKYWLCCNETGLTSCCLRGLPWDAHPLWLLVSHVLTMKYRECKLEYEIFMCITITFTNLKQSWLTIYVNF